MTAQYWTPELGQAQPVALFYGQTCMRKMSIYWTAADDAKARAVFATARIRPSAIRFSGPDELTEIGRRNHPAGKWSALVTYAAYDKIRAHTATEILLD